MAKPKELKSPQDQVEQLARDYKATFNTEAGKRVLEDLELRNFMKTTTFDGNPNIMIYREGQRSVLLHINTMRTADIKRLRELQEAMEKGQDMEVDL